MFENKFFPRNNSRNKIKSKEKLLEETSYSFKPILNPNSLKIAQKLGSTTERLTTTNRQSRKLITPDKGLRETKTPTRSPSNTTSIRHGLHLYENAKLYQQKREEKVAKKRQEEELKIKEFTFKPSTSQSPNKTTQRKLNTNSFYNLQEQWKVNKQKKFERIKDMMDFEKYEECTFRPNIRPLDIHDDEEFIQNHIGQIMDYIVRRKKNLFQDQNKETKKPVKKINNKPTVPKEFNFSSQVKKDRLRSTDNLKMREIIKSNDFFQGDFNFNIDYIPNTKR